MIDGRSVLAVIPARGGSKGLLRKNIAPIAARPLLAWTIDAALGARYVDAVVVSSDDEEVLGVAIELGARTVKRPAALAQDDSRAIDVLLHVIERLDNPFDVIACLQPTSPLRRSEHIDGALALLVSTGADSCVSISSVVKPPHWMYHLDERGLLQRAFPDLPLANRRQDIPSLFSLNGAIYLVSTEQFREEKRLTTGKCVGYQMRPEDSIDIDNELDLRFAEFLLTHRR